MSFTTWFETYKKKKENEKEKIQNKAFEREIKKYVQGAIFNFDTIRILSGVILKI